MTWGPCAPHLRMRAVDQITSASCFQTMRRLGQWFALNCTHSLRRSAWRRVSLVAPLVLLLVAVDAPGLWASSLGCDNKIPGALVVFLVRPPFLSFYVLGAPSSSVSIGRHSRVVEGLRLGCRADRDRLASNRADFGSGRAVAAFGSSRMARF